MRKRRLLNEVQCGIDVDQIGYQLDHNAPNSKLYARAPVFAKRSIDLIADSDFEQLRMCTQRTVGKIWHLAQKSKQRSTFVHDRSVCKMDVARAA